MIRKDATVVTAGPSCCALLLAAMAAAAPALAAPGDPLGPAFLIAGGAGFSPPVVARTPGGDFVTVYDKNGMTAQRFHADGTPNGAPIAVDSNHLVGTAVAADSAGNFAVVWSTFGGSQGSSIMARRFAADGSALGAAFQVSQVEPASGFHYVSGPALAMSADGRFVVSWLRAENLDISPVQLGCLGGVPLATTESSIRFRAYGSDGRAAASEQVAVERSGVFVGVGVFCALQVNLALSELGIGGGPSLTQSAVAMGAAGDFTVAWILDNGSGVGVNGAGLSLSISRLSLQHYTAQGIATGLPQQVQGALSPLQSQQMLNPRIAQGSGGITLAWNVSADPQSLSLIARSYTATPAPRAGASTVRSGKQVWSYDDFRPDIASLPSGSVVAWRSSQLVGSTVPQQVSAQHLDLNSAALGPVIDVANSADGLSLDALSAPGVAADGSGNFVVVWAASNRDESDVRVYGRLYSGR